MFLLAIFVRPEALGNPLLALVREACRVGDRRSVRVSEDGLPGSDNSESDPEDFVLDSKPVVLHSEDSVSDSRQAVPASNDFAGDSDGCLPAPEGNFPVPDDFVPMPHDCILVPDAG